jgi:serine/threonine-protein kinase
MTHSAIDGLFLEFQEAVAGRYSLERELGRGGMGVVYLAREVRLDRPVAIKLLPPELAAQQPLRDRFMREARTAARLSHPYIVPIHSVDEIGGFVFYVMAYVDGETLAQRVAARGPRPPEEVTRILREVAWALAYAHAQGIVHRDVKPANILIEHGNERAMVTDFGIARAAQGGETAVGEVLGTPEYMSPEQAAGEALDGRSDLYALGIVGFFALTGELPFTAPTVQGILMQHLTKPAPPVTSLVRGVPAGLAQAIDKCLQKNATARHATGEALADALAPSLERRAEVPVPIRVFLDRRRAAALIVPIALTMGPASGVIARMGRHGASIAAVAALVGLVVIAIGLPLTFLVRRMRRLLRLGYGAEDIAMALRTSFARRREEFLFEFGPERTKRERLFRAVGAGGLVIAVALAAAAIAGVRSPPLAAIAFVSGYLGILGTVISKKWGRLRDGPGSVWTSFWQGKPGRLLARISSIKLGQRAVAAGRPTELAIAMSAEAVYETFPKELRQSLGDVPEALHGLEGHARNARARIAELDAALADAQRQPGRGVAMDRQDALVRDLNAARHQAEARLAEVVTALENLRLDLLRLRAGAGTAEGITRDVAAARALGDEADRLLAAAREVDATLTTEVH